MGKQRGGNTDEYMIVAIIGFGFYFGLLVAVVSSRIRMPESEADRWTKKDRWRAFYFAFGLIALVSFVLICYDSWLRRTT